MSGIDWPLRPPPVWLTTSILNADGTQGARLPVIDPRLQLYWGGTYPRTSAFQAAHVMAFGGLLTPQHYRAEALWRLSSGAFLGGYEDSILVAKRAHDAKGVVRSYLAHRGLSQQLQQAAHAIHSAAAGGTVTVFGRRMVQGMTRPMAQEHEIIPATAFMSAELDIYANSLGTGLGAITDLRFDLRDPMFKFAIDMSAARFGATIDELNKDPTPVGTVPTWHWRPGELQKAWVVRADVVAEAERRRAAKPTWGLPKHLSIMAAEMGSGWSQAALRNAVGPTRAH